MKTEQYNIAVKREHRANAPEDWSDRLAKTPGVEIGYCNDRRGTFTASKEALAKVKQCFGSYCHIEPVNFHKTS